MKIWLGFLNEKTPLRQQLFFERLFDAPVFVVVDAGVIFPNRRLWYCKFSQATIYSVKRQVCFVFCHANAPALSQTWLCPLRWGWGAVCVCVCGQGWGWGGLGSCDWWVYYSHTSFLFISPALLLNLLVASRWSSKSIFFVVAFAATCLSNWRQSRLFWPADTKHVTVR